MHTCNVPVSMFITKWNKDAHVTQVCLGAVSNIPPCLNFTFSVTKQTKEMSLAISNLTLVPGDPTSSSGLCGCQACSDVQMYMQAKHLYT